MVMLTIKLVSVYTGSCVMHSHSHFIVHVVGTGAEYGGGGGAIPGCYMKYNCGRLRVFD